MRCPFCGEEVEDLIRHLRSGECRAGRPPDDVALIREIVEDLRRRLGLERLHIEVSYWRAGGDVKGLTMIPPFEHPIKQIKVLLYNDFGVALKYAPREAEVALAYTLAHELRHCWQVVRGLYKRDPGTILELENDAESYALSYLAERFGRRFTMEEVKKYMNDLIPRILYEHGSELRRDTVKIVFPPT